jgi:hypothetical protein
MEWRGYLTQAGYGGMSIQVGPNKHTKTTAHRVAYELHYGKVPDGLDVMHSCDNRRCVNWEHLSVGTPKQNTQDMLRKDSRPLISMLLAGKIQPNTGN